MIKFNSAEEMLKMMAEGNMVDLYNPRTETYLFVYNDYGSICEYSSIDKEYAKELAKQAMESGNDYYWGACLGPGGSIYDGLDYIKENTDEYYKEDEIYDHALDYCEGVYMLEGWMTTEEFAKEMEIVAA